MLCSRATQMLFTCSLRSTDQVSSTRARAKLSLCNRNSRLKDALYSDMSLTSCSHTPHHFCVCSIEAHPLAERKEVAFPTKHCSRAKMAPRKVAASGGFSVQHGLMSYRCLRSDMSTFIRHDGTRA